MTRRRPRCRRWLTRFVCGLGGVASAVACGGAPQSSEDDALDLGRRLVNDVAFRRQVLERSLLEADNGYARVRLESYAVPGQWEDLPAQSVNTGPVVYREGSRQAARLESFGSDETAWDEAALLALGKRAFERWPSQPLPTVELALGEVDDPALTRALGLWRDAEGWLGGLVHVEYTSGVSAVAATCATCHSRPDAEGRLEHGPASDLDLARANSDGSDGAVWGPGVLDVTGDGVDDPVAIPDLRATRDQSRLHWSGNVRNGLLELAVRIETLLITNAGGTARPPREIAFALALYVQSLGATAKSPPADTAEDDRGREVFVEQCSRCHSGTWGAGDWVGFEELDDPGRASASERSTGGYRVPSLYLVTERTRLTHYGMATLQDLLDPARLAQRPTHPFGSDLPAADLEALLRFLEGF